jgi:hypothetical protein
VGQRLFPAKLFPVSWLRCPRWPRFPKPDRQRMAVGRRTDQIKTTIMGGRQGIMAAWGRDPGSGRGEGGCLLCAEPLRSQG